MNNCYNYKDKKIQTIIVIIIYSDILFIFIYRRKELL